MRGLTNENDIVVTDGTSAGAGGLTGSDQAPQVSFALKRASAFTGRSARGRVFMPPMLASQLSDNRTVSTAYADAVTAAHNTLVTATLGADWVHVIISRETGGVQRAAAVGFDVVAYSYTDRVVDTQRRRIQN